MWRLYGLNKERKDCIEIKDKFVSFGKFYFSVINDFNIKIWHDTYIVAKPYASVIGITDSPVDYY